MFSVKYNIKMLILSFDPSQYLRCLKYMQTFYGGGGRAADGEGSLFMYYLRYIYIYIYNQMLLNI